MHEIVSNLDLFLRACLRLGVSRWLRLVGLKFSVLQVANNRAELSPAQHVDHRHNIFTLDINQEVLPQNRLENKSLMRANQNFFEEAHAKRLQNNYCSGWLPLFLLVQFFYPKHHTVSKLYIWANVHFLGIKPTALCFAVLMASNGFSIA